MTENWVVELKTLYAYLKPVSSDISSEVALFPNPVPSASMFNVSQSCIENIREPGEEATQRPIVANLAYSGIGWSS